MENIYNEYEYFYVWNIEKQEMKYIGNEKALIRFLADGFFQDWWTGSELRNHYFEDYACSQEDNKYGNKHYQFFNGKDRCINPRDYEREARIYYLNHLKGNPKKYPFHISHIYKGTFRREPVEGIHKAWRGGPFQRTPRTKHIFAMYDNPEYKDYNRGTKKIIPSWWDDKVRHVEMNWKSQRKTRHQWKE